LGTALFRVRFPPGTPYLIKQGRPGTLHPGGIFITVLYLQGGITDYILDKKTMLRAPRRNFMSFSRENARRPSFKKGKKKRGREE